VTMGRTFTVERLIRFSHCDPAESY
jgi:hypothetical protein